MFAGRAGNGAGGMFLANGAQSHKNNTFFVLIFIYFNENIYNE
jgi:hypothetical protein